jgi:hypothetical protein
VCTVQCGALRALHVLAGRGAYAVYTAFADDGAYTPIKGYIANESDNDNGTDVIRILKVESLGVQRLKEREGAGLADAGIGCWEVG